MTSQIYLTEGSIWKSLNSKHWKHLLRVRRVREHTVTIEAASKHGPRQHHDQRYTVAIDRFLTKNVFVRQGRRKS